MATDDNEAPAKAWWRDAIKPGNMFGVIGIVLGVAGIAFAYYSYRVTAYRPELSWTFSKQIIFDVKNLTPDITILDKFGNTIRENVYASQIIIWNSGNVRLDKVDDSTIVREPLRFKLTGSGHIVSASIVDRINDKGGNWMIDPQQAIMSWKYFDTDSAVKLLILYTGNAATDLQPIINLAGARGLRLLTYDTERTPDKDIWPMGILALMIVVYLPLYLYQRAYRNPRFHEGLFLMALRVSSSGFVGILTHYIVNVSSMASMPFSQ